MSETDKIFTGSIPHIYAMYLVPMLFMPYAADMAARVAAGGPATILETAAGTGVVTGALAPLLGKRARYVATDLNQPMLDQAKARQGDDARIEWRQADALALPFPDATFEAGCCAFGVMFFPDRVAGYREARRVLKPGGTFVFSVWDSMQANDFARAVGAGLKAAFPDQPPAFLARTPYAYHDAMLIEAELRAAGFADVSLERIEKRSEAPTARDVAVGFCQGTPLRGEIEARLPGSLERVTALVTEAITRSCGPGPAVGQMQALMVEART